MNKARLAVAVATAITMCLTGLALSPRSFASTPSSTVAMKAGGPHSKLISSSDYVIVKNKVKHEADILYRMKWRDGRPPMTHWAKTASLLVTTDVLRQKTQLCNALDPYEGSTYRLYIWSPVTGRNWSSPPWRIGCQHDTKGSMIKGLSHVPRFFYRDCTSSRWKVTVQEHWSHFIPDRFATMSGKLLGVRAAHTCYSFRK
jgi:hypothetical protein